MACQKPEKSKNLGSSINNEGLDERERQCGEGETICLTSIFGGTSIDEGAFEESRADKPNSLAYGHSIPISGAGLPSTPNSRPNSVQPDEPRAVAVYPSVRRSRRRLLFSSHLSR